MKREHSSPIFEAVGPFTAFPNELLDRVMPTLKDTEWRLLCVIVRQTIGWREKNGGRKSRDWLTQKQLMARTGRNSAALSAALDVLVRRRLVDAFDEVGELLLTPEERRRHRGRVYFGLCGEALQRLADAAPKTPLHKANTTKETGNTKENIKRKMAIRRGTEPDTTPILYTGWKQAADIAASRYFAKDT